MGCPAGVAVYRRILLGPGQGTRHRDDRSVIHAASGHRRTRHFKYGGVHVLVLRSHVDKNLQTHGGLARFCWGLFVNDALTGLRPMQVARAYV